MPTLCDTLYELQHKLHLSWANSLANWLSRFVEHVMFWVSGHVMSMSEVQIIRASVSARRLIPHPAAIYWRWAARRCSWTWPENYKNSQELQCLIIVSGCYLQTFFCEKKTSKNTLFPVYFQIFDICLIHLGCEIAYIDRKGAIQALSRTMDAHQGHLRIHQSKW